MRPWALAIAVGALLAGACGAADDASTTTTTEADVAAPTPTSLPDEVAAAAADLADRLGVEPSNVTMVSHQDVTWSDGSLGCPQPGNSYTQALVDGYRIVLSVDDTEYHYHGRSGGVPFLCEAPRLPGSVGATE
jgi:hypothetical protein